MTFAQLHLDIALPDGRSQVLALPGPGPFWIGRDESCHVVLENPIVSRKHVMITPVPEGALVQDHSHNGTAIDDVLLNGGQRLLSSGSTLRVGPYILRIPKVSAVVPQPKVLVLPAARPFGSTLTPTEPPPSAHDSGSHEKALEVPAVLRRNIHRRLLDSLDLNQLDRNNMDSSDLRPKVIAALRRICMELRDQLPKGEALERLLKELADESLGLGPLEDLLADPDVTEIMVVDPHTVFAEIKGKLRHTPYRFTDNEAVRSAIERIVTPLGRRIDESSPLVDARLKDGSRVNAVIPPLAVKGPCITIRKFSRERLTMNRLIEFGSVTDRMARFLERAVRVRKNIVISGGTGSGKTTLLNVLSSSIPEEERVVTIEDAAELQLNQPHVVSLESRPPNMEGKGAYSIRDLVKNALRMRPDRIVVGECRGGEAIDMLQAMNTGHDGSMTTTHANSPEEALGRLETLCLMSGLDLPIRAIRAQIASSVNLIVQQSRFSDGSRRITSITEITELNENGEIECFEIFRYERTGTKPDGTIVGEYRATGYVPTFVDQFISAGLITQGDYL